MKKAMTTSMTKTEKLTLMDFITTLTVIRGLDELQAAGDRVR